MVPDAVVFSLGNHTIAHCTSPHLELGLPPDPLLSSCVDHATLSLPERVTLVRACLPLTVGATYQ